MSMGEPSTKRTFSETDFASKHLFCFHSSMASNLRSLVSQVPDPNNPAVQGYRNQPKVIGDCEEVMGHYRSLTPKIATLGTTSSSPPFPPTQYPSLPPSLPNKDIRPGARSIPSHEADIGLLCHCMPFPRTAGYHVWGSRHCITFSPGGQHRTLLLSCLCSTDEWLSCSGTVHNNGEEYTLLSLQGTIPMFVNSTKYNCPMVSFRVATAARNPSYSSLSTGSFFGCNHALFGRRSHHRHRHISTTIMITALLSMWIEQTFWIPLDYPTTQPTCYVSPTQSVPHIIPHVLASPLVESCPPIPILDLAINNQQATINSREMKKLSVKLPMRW